MHARRPSDGGGNDAPRRAHGPHRRCTLLGLGHASPSQKVASGVKQEGHSRGEHEESQNPRSTQTGGQQPRANEGAEHAGNRVQHGERPLPRLVHGLRELPRAEGDDHGGAAEAWCCHDQCGYHPPLVAGEREADELQGVHRQAHLGDRLQRPSRELAGRLYRERQDGSLDEELQAASQSDEDAQLVAVPAQGRLNPQDVDRGIGGHPQAVESQGEAEPLQARRAPKGTQHRAVRCLLGRGRPGEPSGRPGPCKSPGHGPGNPPRAPPSQVAKRHVLRQEERHAGNGQDAQAVGASERPDAAVSQGHGATQRRPERERSAHGRKEAPVRQRVGLLLLKLVLDAAALHQSS
mmetsp:Transcript_111791/g.348401  ORF Transcript_111791/g.348401 Transcript_111791/m.348401 type:complete len:350 (+) Transcript_111791:110-1159(+)